MGQFFPQKTKNANSKKTVNTANLRKPFFGLLGVDCLAVGVIMRIIEKLHKHKLSIFTTSAEGLPLTLAGFCVGCCATQQDRHKTKKATDDQRPAKRKWQAQSEPPPQHPPRTRAGAEAPRGRLDDRQNKKEKRLHYTEEKARAFSVA